MEIVIKALQFICSLSLLVLIHEFGHFIFARMSGMRVDKFYLFFNPWFSLFKIKIGHTTYGIGWVPFGGYCKIAGMIDESMDKEQLAQPPKPYEFRSKPAWQRLLVMIGGVLMNVVLAALIYIGICWAWGEKYINNEDVTYGWAFNELGQEIGFRDGDRILTVGGETVDIAGKVPAEIVLNRASQVEVLRDGQRVTIDIASDYLSRMLDSPDLMQIRMPFVAEKVIGGEGAAAAGMLPGDSLVAADGQPMLYFNQFVDYFGSHKGGNVALTVARRDEQGAVSEQNLTVAVNSEGKIGVEPYEPERFLPVQTRDYTLLQSIPAGVKLAGQKIGSYWQQLKLIVNPEAKAYKSVGGPIMIFSVFPGQWDWFSFLNLTAFLSIALAVLNILPIPALDGGHVVFVLYEMITGRKPSEKFLEYAQMVGFILLLLLMIFAFGNDIRRFFIK